jgi:hypothetical protein
VVPAQLKYFATETRSIHNSMQRGDGLDDGIIWASQGGKVSLSIIGSRDYKYQLVTYVDRQ